LEKLENGMCTAAIDDDNDDDNDDDYDDNDYDYDNYAEKASVSPEFVKQIVSLRYSDYITYNTS
jgi:hypothetical protein